MYHNFMLFRVGIFMLVNSSLCTQYCDFADQLLRPITLQSYGRNMLVYNVHGLVHLADEVRQFGCLDNVSAFPFEHFLQNFKKLIRKPNFALQQIINRLSEIGGGKGLYDAAMQIEPLLKGEHSGGFQSRNTKILSSQQLRAVTVQLGSQMILL